jgi:hypothetical protein
MEQGKSARPDIAANDERPKKKYKESDGKIEIPDLSFAQLENKCFVCGKPGHFTENKIP